MHSDEDEVFGDFGHDCAVAGCANRRSAGEDVCAPHREELSDDQIHAEIMSVYEEAAW